MHILKNNRVLLAIKLFSCIILIFSLSLNIILFNKAISYYKALNILRLDPLEMNSLIKIQKNISSVNNESSIILFGDSRIADWHPYFTIPGCRLINRGIHGQTTEQLMLRLKKDVLAFSPDIVVLQAGINDIKTIGLFPKRKEDIIAQCKKNISEIINQISNHDIKMVVLTIFPPSRPNMLRKIFWTKGISNAVKDVNNYIKSLHNQNTCIIDLEPLLNIDGYLNSEYTKDFLHLNLNGYSRLNTFLQPILQKILDSRANNSLNSKKPF